MLKCTEQEAYFEASEAAHAIEPTAATAVGCGYMYYKKGDIEKSINYFDQAIELEQDPIENANKAISFNPNKGDAYILIAQMYAASPNWSDEGALNKCTYFAAIDKLQRAKSVDPSVAEKANELIRTYSAYVPKDEDLF